MKITSFAIHKVMSNGSMENGQPDAAQSFFGSPALIDSDPELPVQAFTTVPVTLITPNLRSPTSVNLVIRVEFDEEDFDTQFNIGVILTNPSGMKRHCAYWIFSGAAAVRHDSELPQDRSFMVEFHDFAFTFVEEGRFVISLAIREEDSTEQKPESYEQWISEFDDLLASAPLDVISE